MAFYPLWRDAAAAQPIQLTWQNDKTDAGFHNLIGRCRCMRDRSDRLKFRARIALTIVIAATTIAVLIWDMVEILF